MKVAEFKKQQPVITGGRFIATLIIILFLIVFSLAVVSYFGDSADLEQKELKEALKTCITSKENIEEELQRTKEAEFESSQIKTYNNFAEFKDIYQKWVDIKVVEYSNCTHSLKECQKELREQGEAASNKALELLNAEKLHQVEMKFKDSQLKECHSRLNRTIEVLKSKGIEPVTI